MRTCIIHDSRHRYSTYTRTHRARRCELNERVYIYNYSAEIPAIILYRSLAHPGLLAYKLTCMYKQLAPLTVVLRSQTSVQESGCVRLQYNSQDFGRGGPGPLGPPLDPPLGFRATGHMQSLAGRVWHQQCFLREVKCPFTGHISLCLSSCT